MWESWRAFVLVDGFIAVLLYLEMLEIWLTYKNGRPVGSYVQEFLSAHPWVKIGLALFVGALVGHFFAKGPIPWG